MTAAEATSASAAGAASLSGLRVLVVEDSWHVARALKTLLEELGVDVAGPVATEADAEVLIGQRQPEAAVVDINLKGELAYGLIDRLHDRGVRIIIISGCAVPQVAEDKVAGILQKPFSAKSLLALLREVASGARAHG